MAQILGLNDLFARADFLLDLNLIPEEQFTNEKFNGLPTYLIPDNARVPDLQNLANLLKTQLTTGAITENTPKIVLVLAMYLDGRDKASSPLMIHKPMGGEAFNIATLLGEVPANNPLMDFEGVGPVIREGESDAEFKIRVLVTQAQAIGVQQIPAPLQGANVSLRYMKFFAAHSLRLIVKAPSNMATSKQKLDAAYSKIYAENPEININVSETTWDKLKAMISRMSTLINTWVRCVATYESAEDQDSDNAEMIRHLANLPLSFAGMHAYSLFLEVMRSTSKDMKWLLTEMCTSPTKGPLDQIIDIALRFEQKIGDERRPPTYYRYARVISPKFFTRIQTKNALSLVYLETRVLCHYVDFGDQGPDKIMALATLGKAHRDFLDAHAREIIAKITTEGDICMLQRGAKTAPVAAANPQEAGLLL